MVLQDRLEDDILYLTLDNPPANALSEAVLDSLQLQLENANENKNVRAIVISANGKLFSAGHDLKEMQANRGGKDGGRDYFQFIMAKCSCVMQSIVFHNKPVISQVNGAAYAAGCQLVASCDLAYASDVSTFCTPGVNIGLFCSTPMVALSRTVNNKHAMEMLISGEPIGAKKAFEIGLINDVVSQDELPKKIDEVCKKIRAKSSAILKIGKQAFYKQREMPLSQAYDFASNVMVENMLHKDAIEGIGAFIEHRPPNWN